MNIYVAVNYINLILDIVSIVEFVGKKKPGELVKQLGFIN